MAGREDSTPKGSLSGPAFRGSSRAFRGGARGRRQPAFARDDVRVDGGRLDARVAEQRLHVAHVGAALEKVRRAPVAERVGCHADVEPRRLRVRPHEVLDPVYRDPDSAAVQEERCSRGSLRKAAAPL